MVGNVGPGRISRNCRGRARRGIKTADMEDSSVVDATDAEEDCWLLLGDIAQPIVNRAGPQARAPGRSNVVAFPGRAPKREDGGDVPR